MAQNQQNETQEFQEEYHQIKKDIRKVAITNVLIILLLVALFLVNRKMGLLDKLPKFF